MGNVNNGIGGYLILDAENKTQFVYPGIMDLLAKNKKPVYVINVDSRCSTPIPVTVYRESNGAYHLTGVVKFGGTLDSVRMVNMSCFTEDNVTITVKDQKFGV